MTANPRTNNWMALAPDFPELKCENRPEMFFPETPSEMMKILPFAKQVCFSCIHRVQCLEYAITEDLRFGIYGGESPTAREEIRRRRGMKRKCEPKRELGKAEYRMRMEGESWQSIAATFAVTIKTVEKRVQRYKAKMDLEAVGKSQVVA